MGFGRGLRAGVWQGFGFRVCTSPGARSVARKGPAGVASYQRNQSTVFPPWINPSPHTTSGRGAGVAKDRTLATVGRLPYLLLQSHKSVVLASAGRHEQANPKPKTLVKRNHSPLNPHS